MKKEYIIYNGAGWSTIFTFVFFLFYCGSLQAQIEKTKTYSGEYEQLQKLVINHRRGTLNVHQSTDGKFRFEATILIKAKDEAAAQMMIDRFKLTEEVFDNELEVSSNFDITNWSTINGKTKIKFKDGTKISGIREVEVNMVAYVPEMESLKLKNRYDEIKIHDDIGGNILVDLHSGKLRCVDMKNTNLNLKLKYSKAFLKNIADSKMDIYDSDIEMGNAGKIQIESKYSKFTMGNLTEFIGDTYDDNYEMGNVAGILVLEDKYSEFFIGNIKTGKFEFHDGELITGNADAMEIKSKYTTFKFENVGSIDFESSYDDDLKAKQVGSLTANSKYSSFDLNTVDKEVRIAPSHDDDLEIERLGANFEKLELDGKYTNFDVDLEENAKYHLNVNMNYGSVKFDEANFETTIWKEKGATKEVVGKSKGATDTNGKIIIKGHDNSVSIR